MTTQELLRKVILDRVSDIRFFISTGRSKEDAIAMVRERSTLGPKAWATVLELLDNPHATLISL